MRETSLEDFFGGSDDEQSEPTASEDDSEADECDPQRADEEVSESDREVGESDGTEPATVTYAWTPEGTDCADCGASVERRWRCGGRLVCADCKRW